MDEMECTNKGCQYFNEEYVANCQASCPHDDEPIFAKKGVNCQPPTSDQPSSPGWISVKDRVPRMMVVFGKVQPYSKEVLTWDGGCIIGMFQNGNAEKEWRDCGEGFSIDPSHWMELPKAPS